MAKTAHFRPTSLLRYACLFGALLFGVENFPGERLPFKGSATGEVVERVLEGEADLQVAQI